VIGYIRLTADYSRLVSGLAPSPIAGVRVLMRVHAWSGMRRYIRIAGRTGSVLIEKVAPDPLFQRVITMQLL
jgi:hypothetical protein